MNTHQKWLEQIKTFNLGDLTLPPPTLQELGLEYIEIKPGQKMVAKVPFQKRFTNPVGLYQGGMIGACVDEVFGPLSYMAAGFATITLSMNMTFLGQFTEESGFIIIEAVVLKKTKNFIFMRAEVKNHQNELIAHAESHVKVLK